MAKIKELRGIRDIYFNQLQETFDVGQAAEDDDRLRAFFARRYLRVAKIKTKFMTAHESIVSTVAASANPDLLAEDTVRKGFDNYFYDIEEKYARWFETTPQTAMPVQASFHPRSHQGIRLPEIPLKQFNGDFTQWVTFKQSFDSAIHNNNSLTPFNRFQYLLSCLSGEPLNLIKSLPLTDANYQIAYDQLTSRYSDDRKLATQYWAAIKALPNLQTESAKGLRTLVDKFKESRAALHAMKINSLEDFLWFHLMFDKLDQQTKRLFETTCRDDKDIPSFEKLTRFIESQCRILESVGTDAHKATKAEKPQTPKTSLVAKVEPENRQQCPICSASHVIYGCSDFKAMKPAERHAQVKRLRLCYNCLKSTHSVAKCPSKQTCKECQEPHHSLVHLGAFTEQPRPAEETTSGQQSASTTNIHASAFAPLSTSVLLATLSIRLLDKWGTPHKARAVLDPGSQASFIVHQLAKQLGLPRARHATPILGLGGNASESSGSISATLCPRDSCSTQLKANLVVLNRICGDLPGFSVDTSLSHIRDVKLADVDWFKSKPVDILLGAYLYPSIILSGLISGSATQPVAINTIFGWAIVGPTGTTPSAAQSLLVSLEPPLDSALHKFWELEEPSHIDRPLLSASEQGAEASFTHSITQTLEGRFAVALPFKGLPPKFHNSCAIADRRWLNLEKRLDSQLILRKMYLDFMQDYLAAGHMSLVESAVDSQAYFIPHHGVLKSPDHCPKLRVVFDAFARDAKGLSLNDCQLVGPKLQANIVALLLRFRSKPVVFTCDIRQMYRQILIVPEHQQYQLIRFRFCPEEPLQTYQLHTVTYGVSSSPFLAIRTLHFLAEQNQDRFPLAARAIQTALYVDDFVCGCDSLEDARQVKAEIVELLALGGFQLRKWASNMEELLVDIPENHKQLSVTTFDNDGSTSIKVLGLEWNSSSDIFRFEINSDHRQCSKRSILSDVARIYDPLGFLAPVSFVAKCLIQQLWVAGIGWDDSPPDEIVHTWSKFRQEILLLSSLKIPRLVLPSKCADDLELHGFCDASQQGYACALYIRAAHGSTSHVNLLFARAKVAPLKTLSIPRLELCGATLLAKSVKFVVHSLKEVISFSRVVAWCDSTVALTWIKSPSSRWKTFVANRVSQIHEVISPDGWRYIHTKDNPADLPSRGCSPNTILESSLWWAGPSWLSADAEQWPAPTQTSLDNLGARQEERTVVTLVAQALPDDCLIQLLNRCSRLQVALRAVALCRRFLRRVHNTASITGEETTQSLHTIIKRIQEQVFGQAIQDIRAKKLPCRPLRNLSLFLDAAGLLRVGGRLRHSELSYDAKHPLLLPADSRLTTLIIDHYHKIHGHPGSNTLHFLLRQEFWILAARRSIRRRTQRCHNCWRTNPRCSTPKMSDLPQVRISELRAFRRVGVDYGGPFSVTMSRRRGAKSSKAWICLFVCFTTKAIHLELASDLSTDAFIAAFRRMVARRGKPTDVHSDCGINFVGASRKLDEYMQIAVEQQAVTWHFNPPAAPHFGGLWEAGIKSVKTHLQRIVGTQIFTYEEFYTLLVQIEALLNSRPLCALSSDPNDLSVLTPGHFLTLEPLSALPGPSDTEPPANKLKRWQLLQCLHRDFWRRWHAEYLHELQQRPKWHLPAVSLTIGSLVLIKDEASPPLQWRLGRILELFPGKDNVARVASVQTKTGTFKRPVAKLAPLPIAED